MGRYIPQREWDAINRMEFSATDLRLSELERKYLFAAAKARELSEKFTADGDHECAAIAFYSWHNPLRLRWQSVRRIQKQIDAAKRAARIARRHGHGGTR